MIQAIIAIAGVAVLILRIVIYLGSPKREKQLHLQRIRKEMKEVQHELEKATNDNNTIAISKHMYRLCELRQTYNLISNG